MVEKPNLLVSAFVDVFQRCWPELLPYSSHLEDGSFALSVPSPYREDGERLTVVADPDFDEVIVGFSYAHSHGGPWDQESAADYQFASSIEFINGILQERVLACQYDGHARIGLLEDLRQLPDWSLVRSIRSWRGTHDRG